jgi:hypothetical protein
MKLLSYGILALVFLISGAPIVTAQSNPDAWGEQIEPGIEYREYNLPDPNNVFVARMERSNLEVTIESSIGQGRLSGGVEAVSDMALRYDEAINYWDQNWGNRNKVAVAINGFYYGNPTEPVGVPWSGQIHSGWYAKRFWDLQSGSGFAWKLDRSAFIGECISHPADKQQVTYFRDGLVIGNQFFDGINVAREADQFILYTPQFDGATTTPNSFEAIEVLVQLTNPALIIPYGDMAVAEKGTIVDIRNNKGATLIPFDHVVLSMHGDKKDEFLTLGIEEGDQVGISQRIKNCAAAPEVDWNETYASIGGAFYFLKAGVIQDFSDDDQANVRDPRTAIAFNDDYIFFIVVDGRDVNNSIGMTIPQLAAFARDELGATYGIAQDGGGSSTMVVDGEVKNNTFCNNTTACMDKYHTNIPIVSNGGTKSQMTEDGSQREISLGVSLSADGIPFTEENFTSSLGESGEKLTRMVANGMMMVVVEPKELSTADFTQGEQVATLEDTGVRLGPGTNYGRIETVPVGTTGIIYGFDNELNGVLSKGSYWWRVLLEIGDRDIIGWVTESSLTSMAP